MSVEVFDLNEVSGFKPVQGMDGRAVLGVHMQLTYVTFDPGAIVPTHSHPQEQIGLLIKGNATLLLDAGDVYLTELSSYSVPGDVRHGLIVGSEGAVFVEAFHPPRQDYIDAACGRSVIPFQ